VTAKSLTRWRGGGVAALLGAWLLALLSTEKARSIRAEASAASFPPDAVQLSLLREAIARSQSGKNLHNLAIALHMYHDVAGRFPPQAAYDKRGKPMLSWRVMLLPFIGQQDLYKQFRLHEPWDSEHNKKLLPRMPKLYASPRDEKTAKEHSTYYQGFVGKGAFFDGKTGIRFMDIPDGSSTTIMTIEASKAVPWTKPEDIPYDPSKPLPKLGILGSRNIAVMFCDGSVHTITSRTSERTLRAAITRDDGQPLGSDFD
jgi:hypothetical protein